MSPHRGRLRLCGACSCCSCSLHLRSVLSTHDLQVVELSARAEDLLLELRFRTDQLRDLALNLADFLDHHLLEELLAQHGDRHDRTGALATLVGGDLVRSVSVLVAHAIIIAIQAADATPSGDESGNIFDIS
jgi:hypothetical protein